MSRNKIRKDKTCLNCRHVVENRFCPNCGQENTDTRKTFQHLFIHFFEDLTHYENAFWKTIRNLIFKPASLTKEYLSGKRLSYLAPVRLYIFISFIAFFLLAVLVSPNDPEGPDSVVKLKTGVGTIEAMAATKDSIRLATAKIDTLFEKGLLSKEEAARLRDAMKKSYRSSEYYSFDNEYNTIEELDYAYKNKKGEEAITDFEYYFMSKLIKVSDKYTKEELKIKFTESLIGNSPKVLFIYMPLFAFILWLFHDKKRWYYFDHGIFTLHYFSFLILVFLSVFLVRWAFSFLGDTFFANLVPGVFTFVALVWMAYYFFPAHHRFYGETRVISFIKSIFLLGINLMFMSIIMIAFITYTFINLH